MVVSPDWQRSCVALVEETVSSRCVGCRPCLRHPSVVLLEQWLFKGSPDRPGRHVFVSAHRSQRAVSSSFFGPVSPPLDPVLHQWLGFRCPVRSPSPPSQLSNPRGFCLEPTTLPASTKSFGQSYLMYLRPRSIPNRPSCRTKCH